MLEDYLVVGIAWIVVEVVKYLWLKEEQIPEPLRGRILALCVIALAGLLNVVNMLVFDPAVGTVSALSAGIKIGAMAAGIHTLGKNLLGVE